MFSFEITMLGLALAIDAAVVSFAYGLICKEHSNSEKWKRGLIIGIAFGFAQFLMLWLGSIAGYFFTFSSIGHLFQIVVAGCFLILAIKCIQESFNDEDRSLEWGIGPLCLLALATSLDSLAAGVSLGSLPHSYLVAFEVGIITFATCGLFFLCSHFFKSIPERWLLRLAAAMFAFLGGRVVWSFIL